VVFAVPCDLWYGGKVCAGQHQATHVFAFQLSDFQSLSSISSMANKEREHHIALQIPLKYHSLITQSFNIIFCWFPSHVGISGNEKADKAAKSALNKPIVRIPVPYTDLKPIIKNIYMTSGSKRGTHKQKINYQIYPTIPSYSTLPTSY